MMPEPLTQPFIRAASSQGPFIYSEDDLVVVSPLCQGMHFKTYGSKSSQGMSSYDV